MVRAQLVELLLMQMHKEMCITTNPFSINDQGKLDVRRAVGTEGAIQVVKDVGMKDYFSGASPIVSGELGEDFTYYFATSEQTPSSVGLGVLLT